jgi:hypothetical protein
MFLDPGFEDFRVAMVARSLGETPVKNAVPFLFEVRGVVAHGRVEKSQLLLVVMKVPGPGCGFDHAHASVFGRGGEKRVVRQ